MLNKNYRNIFVDSIIDLFINSRTIKCVTYPLYFTGCPVNHVTLSPEALHASNKPNMSIEKLHEFRSYFYSHETLLLKLDLFDAYRESHATFLWAY